MIRVAPAAYGADPRPAVTDRGREKRDDMTMRRLDAVGVVLSLIGRVRDPRERLGALVAVRAEMRDHDDRMRDEIRKAVAELRSADVSIAEIARILKVTPQRAHVLAAQTQQENPSHATH